MKAYHEPTLLFFSPKKRRKGIQILLFLVDQLSVMLKLLVALGSSVFFDENLSETVSFGDNYGIVGFLSGVKRSE